MVSSKCCATSPANWFSSAVWTRLSVLLNTIAKPSLLLLGTLVVDSLSFIYSFASLSSQPQTFSAYSRSPIRSPTTLAVLSSLGFRFALGESALTASLCRCWCSSMCLAMLSGDSK